MVAVKGFVLAAVAAVATAKSAVIDLTPANFDTVVTNSGIPTLVEFFAPWCGHCKTLAPVYEELATAFEFAKSKVQIAKVDADAEKLLGKRFGIQGFPTLKFFDGKSDQPTDYSGGRDLEGLTNYIMDKTGIKMRKKQDMPSQVKMLNDNTLPETIGKSQNVLVAFTAPWCGRKHVSSPTSRYLLITLKIDCKKLAPTWETLAADFANDPNVVIAKVDVEAPDSKTAAAAYDVTGYPTIKFFPAGSAKPETYNQGRLEEDLVKYINEQAGTHRLPGGELDSDAGTIESLNDIVLKMTSIDGLAELGKDAKKLASAFTDETQKKYAEYYVRVFDKLGASDNYVAKELSRLDGILAKGGLEPTKRDEFRAKSNVLRKFVDALGQTVKPGRKEEL